VNILRSAQCTVGASAAAAILAACNGGVSQLAPTATSGVPSTVRNGGTVVVHSSRGRSWMDPSAKTGSLLYVTDAGTNTVVVYSYPKFKIVGTLTGFTNPQGDCVDKANNVWIANTQTSQLIEYAHGGTTPIATLDDPNQYPVGCSFELLYHQRAAGQRFHLQECVGIADRLHAAELRGRLLFGV
jgi:hypothetical protein